MAKRPCRECGHWFEPNPRAGDRQRTCSAPACQRARNQKACRKWRAKSDTPIHRLKKRIRAAKADSHQDCVSLNADHWKAMGNAVPPEMVVVLQELVRLLDIWMRHAVALKTGAEPGLPLEVHPADVRHADTTSPPPPLRPP